MSRGPTTFRKRDVTAAIKAVRAAGQEVRRVVVDKSGKIVVEVGEPTANGTCSNPWDEVLCNAEDKKRATEAL